MSLAAAYSVTEVYDLAFSLRSLKPLDIEIMKRLGTRVNLIPVIAKADTLTQNDLAIFKQRVRILGTSINPISESFSDSRGYLRSRHSCLRPSC